MAIVVAIFFAVLFSPIFVIKSIEFNAQSCLSDQKQLEKYQVLSKNILLFKSDEISYNLKNDFSCIDQIKITKALPAKLKIEIAVQKPVAKIEGKDLTLTKDGAISTSIQTESLPTIFLPSSVSVAVSQKVEDKMVLFALDVAFQLQKTDFTVQNIRFPQAEDVAFYDAHALIALFSSSKAASTQVDSLQGILAKAKIDEAKIAKIDLRFDKPVIVNR